MEFGNRCTARYDIQRASDDICSSILFIDDKYAHDAHTFCDNYVHSFSTPFVCYNKLQRHSDARDGAFSVKH